MEIPSLRGTPITKQVWNSKDQYIPNVCHRRVRGKFQRGLQSSCARRASSPGKSSDYRKKNCIIRKQALITIGVTEGHCSSVTFTSVRVWRSHCFQTKTCWLVLLGAGFKDSRMRFNAWGVHLSLNRCEVLLNTSLMQVNQRFAAAISKEKLHVHDTRTTPTPESRQRTLWSENHRRLAFICKIVWPRWPNWLIKAQTSLMGGRDIS